MPRADLDRYLARPLRRYTPCTLVQPAALRAAIMGIRIDGYALGKDQTGLGTISLTVPVFSDTGRLVSGLTIAGPTYRLTEDRIRSHLPKLKQLSAVMTDTITDTTD